MVKNNEDEKEYSRFCLRMTSIITCGILGVTSIIGIFFGREGLLVIGAGLIIVFACFILGLNSL